MSISTKIRTSLYLLILTAVQFSYPQEFNRTDFEYISPIPKSGMNMPETNIIIRYGSAYSSIDVYSQKLLEVKGEKSGVHSGEIIFAENNRTLLFNPDFSFQLGETVTVRFLRSAKTEDDQTIPALNFSFRITEKNINEIVKPNPEKYLFTELSELSRTNNNSLSEESNNFRYSVMDDSLPADFPALEINSINNPTPGDIFYTPFAYPSFLPTYLIISDNYGMPIFYRKMNATTFDFKKLENGKLAYFTTMTNQYFLMDSSYNIIDTVYTKNGYSTDLHEIITFDNGHYFLMSYDAQQVAMDTVIVGGNPNATVIGIILQELDENKNVVFQWRSWDHFKITDATDDIDLTDSIIDYVHSNSIEIDTDGNILLSSRHLDEVTKINRQTGDIIWRWGGEHCKNNEFTFLNDPIGFSHQHDARRLENGNITLFDNGNLHSPEFSRVAEYQLDEINKYATLVWEYRNEPSTYSVAMGNARRLTNHNTFIGWGTGTDPAISEVRADGEVALHISFPDTLINYRAFKFPWKTNLFVGIPESLYFGYVPLNDSLELQLELTNNSDQQIDINSIYTRESVYRIIETLPIVLTPFGATTIRVKFKPESDIDYFDDLHLRWNTEGQRIAQVIPLIGSADPNFTSVETEVGLNEFTLSQNYPNPFNPSTTIRYQLPVKSFVTIKIYDILGREVATLVTEEKPSGNYDVQFEGTGLTSGIYFYHLKAGDYSETKKMILLR